MLSSLSDSSEDSMRAVCVFHVDGWAVAIVRRPPDILDQS